MALLVEVWDNGLDLKVLSAGTLFLCDGSCVNSLNLCSGVGSTVSVLGREVRQFAQARLAKCPPFIRLVRRDCFSSWPQRHRGLQYDSTVLIDSTYCRLTERANSMTEIITTMAVAHSALYSLYGERCPFLPRLCTVLRRGESWQQG